MAGLRPRRSMLIEKWMGLAVPNRDNSNVRLRRLSQGGYAMDRLEKMFTDKGVCVQAGGNWGYWPLRMTKLFDVVYTFEPDPICFACLCMNTATHENIYRFQAALGNERKLVELWRDTDTTGNQRVQGEGHIPTMRIDDLGLTKCDLIYLDIEGEELNALQGAMETIRRCKPVIIYEDRQAFAHNDAIPGILPGYKRDGAIGSDQILRHAV